MNQKRNYFRTFASHTEEFSANMTYMLRELPVEQNQMDLIISLRDPYVGKRQEPDSNKIFRLCDTYIIPLATNLASAELLIKSLDRGELDWREIYK